MAFATLRGLTAAAALFAIGGTPSDGAPSQRPDLDYQITRRDAVVRAVEAVSPAVVNISTEKLVQNPYYGRDDFWSWFQGMRPRRQREYVENSLGSGVLVDPDGLVLTNEHVVGAADRIFVTLADGRQVEADIVGSDRASDLAVLRLKEKGPWPAVRMGRSDDLMIGETVIAIGNPFGLQSTVTLGVVSALGRTLQSDPENGDAYADFVQTDAAINPGNSGGALLNVLGELVGINTQIVARGQNLGFAIPIDRARKVLDELVHYGRVRPMWTGMIVEELDAGLARDMDMPDVKGVIVVQRFSESPAESADVRAGDIVLEIDGQKVTTIAEYETVLARAGRGNTVRAKIRRGAETLERRVRVETFPADRAPRMAWEVLGLRVVQGRETVLIDEVRPDSTLARRARGSLRGLAIVSIDGKQIETVEQFHDAIPTTIYRRTANLVISDGRRYYRVGIPIRR